MSGSHDVTRPGSGGLGDDPVGGVLDRLREPLVGEFLDGENESVAVLGERLECGY